MAITTLTATTTKMTMPNASCMHHDCAHVATAQAQDDGPAAPDPLFRPVRAGDRHRARARRLDRAGGLGRVRLSAWPNVRFVTNATGEYPVHPLLTDQSIVTPDQPQRPAAPQPEEQPWS